jgi:hypothetical protein
MNDKIYELAKKAGLIEFESIHDSAAKTPNIESVAKARKFALSILKECATIADDGYGSAHFGNGIAGYQLLEHFGVNE